jgi:hypothetical protein
VTDDIVARLRQFDADLEKEIADGEHGDGGHLWVIPFDCLLQAADEIERLREERDEARRIICHDESYNHKSGVTPREVAIDRGWDCFKEKP